LNKRFLRVVECDHSSK